jgi:excisionase family DNA binding protein
MQDLLFSPVPIEQLKAELSETIKKELQALLLVIQPPKEQTEYLTRKEAANLLSISLPTLNEWTKEGKVIGYRIASRVRYKRSELETALIQIHTSKSKRRAA